MAKTGESNERWYLYKDKPVPSVTTVISAVWPPGGLTYWRMKNVARKLATPENSEAFSRISTRSSALREMGVDIWGDKFVDWRDDTTKADRGTRIHLAFEFVMRGWATLRYYREEGKLALDEYETLKNAVEFLREQGVTKGLCEVKLFGTTPGLRYAGTADLIVSLNGRKVVLDLKTGRNLSKTWSPQLGAHANPNLSLIHI